MISVLLLSDLTRDTDRKLVHGISQYNKEEAGWVFYLASSSARNDRAHAAEIIDKAKTLKVNAIFGSWPGIDVEAARRLGIPIVLRSDAHMGSGISAAYSNNEAISRMAADHFRRLGMENVAFSGFEGSLWSDARRAGLEAAMPGGLCGAISFSDRESDWDRIASWLRDLPKPVGIFACNDRNARMVIEVCQSIGFSIPDEVSVLGVDDDTFLCNMTSPGISTIKMDYEKLGYEVGSRIFKAVKAHSCKSFSIEDRPVGIVERGSTKQLGIRDRYVRQVVDTMERSFSEGKGLGEMLSGIPLSRRSIEQRFKKQFGNVTMLQYLTSLRLEKMKGLLAGTDMALKEISMESGFSDSENIYRLFKQKVGCSPTEYRKIHSKDL